MNRKLFLMIGAIAGAAMLVCILFIPVAGEGKFTRNFIEIGAIGVVFTLLGVAAAGYSVALFLGKSHLVGPDEGRVVNSAFGCFALAVFLGLAVLIAQEGLKAGSWLYWISSIAGMLGLLMAANPALAKKLAEATKDTSSESKSDRAE